MVVTLEQVARHPVERQLFTDMATGIIGDGVVTTWLAADFSIMHSRYSIQFISLTKAMVSCDGAEAVGEINNMFFQTNKVWFFPIGYEYQELRWRSERFQCYESGFGVDQHYYTMYCGTEVVGVIHKRDLVKNYCDSYTLYTKNQHTMEALLVYGMFLECSYFKDRTAGLENIDDFDSVYTAQKELRDKYDPTFIPSVLALDGQ